MSELKFKFIAIQLQILVFLSPCINILKIDSDTRYNVVERKENYSVLCYGDNKIIDVPNELLPFFMDNDTVLYYEDGKFEKDYNEF